MATEAVKMCDGGRAPVGSDMGRRLAAYQLWRSGSFTPEMFENMDRANLCNTVHVQVKYAF